MLLIIPSILFCVKTVFAVHVAPGDDMPIHHAKELQRMLLPLLGRSADVDGGSIVNYLIDNITDLDAGDPTRLNLDTIDLNTLEKIVEIMGKQKTAEEIKNPVISRRDKGRHQAYYHDAEALTILKSMTEQSLYATRFNLLRTRKFRKLYTNSYFYLLGTQYGSLMQMRHKMENLYSTIRKLQTRGQRRRSVFWFLMVYTKIVATHIDIRFLVQRMFQIKSRIPDLMKLNKADDDAHEVEYDKPHLG